MRLYVYPFAPNAVRVQVFAAEKGIALETVEVSPESWINYLKINPLGQVPALELDDGEAISESLTICQYLDAISGLPALFGEGPEERARISMWERRAELLLFIPSIEYGHHTHATFAGRLVQHPEWAKTLIPKAGRFLDVMGDRLDDEAFLAGPDFTAADITAYLGYFGLVAHGGLSPSDRPSVRAWTAAMAERDSMAILKSLAARFGVASATA